MKCKIGDIIDIKKKYKLRTKRMRQYETYKCDKCGNEIEVQEVGGGKLTCCGEEMVCTTENLTAVNLMKHLPVKVWQETNDLFADIAEEEGWHAISRHFREASINEMWHARAQYKA